MSIYDIILENVTEVLSSLENNNEQSSNMQRLNEIIDLITL